MLDELVLDRISLNDINQAFDSFLDCNCINVGRSVIEFAAEPVQKAVTENDALDIVS